MTFSGMHAAYLIISQPNEVLGLSSTLSYASAIHTEAMGLHPSACYPLYNAVNTGELYRNMQ